MINFDSRTKFFMKSTPTDMRKGYEGLASIERAAGDKYGQMVHRAVDYILDDEDAFRTFLSDGRIDMHNIAIERCFRHIAMGRRNWLQTGSHFSVQNLAFMFGL